MSEQRKRNKKAIQQIRRDLKATLDNKYYNLWMSKYDTDLDPQVYHYIFKEFYNVGTISGARLKHTDELVVAPYTTQEYNQYDYPEKIQMINKKNSPLIPSGNLIVNKDVVIGYCLSNHKSFKFMVDKYIERMLDVEMVINTQLETLKLPFLVGIAPEDKARAEDIVDKILNNEPVIFMDLQDLAMVKVLVNNNPYIIDKLVQYEQSIECQLLTYMGLDNAVSQTVNLDITNANNNLINAFKEDIDSNIQNFVKQCAQYLGINFYLKMKQPEVQSIYEEDNPSLEDNVSGQKKIKEGAQ